MFFVVRSNDSFNYPLGWIKYVVIVIVPASHPSHCYCFFFFVVLLLLLLLFCLWKDKIKATAHATITWWCPVCPSKPPFLSGYKQHGRERTGLYYSRAHSNNRVDHAVPAATDLAPDAPSYCCITLHNTITTQWYRTMPEKTLLPFPSSNSLPPHPHKHSWWNGFQQNLGSVIKF